MTRVARIRERRLWTLVVVLLGAGLAWLAALNLMLIVNVRGQGVPELLLVLKTVVKVSIALVGYSWPVLPAGLFAAGLAALIVRTPGTGVTRGGRVHRG